MKKFKYILFMSSLLMIFGIGLLSCNKTDGYVITDYITNSDNTNTLTDEGIVNNVDKISDTFKNADLKDVSIEEADVTIKLDGSSVESSDTTRTSIANNSITITSKGIYKITGSSKDIMILINDELKSGNVYLYFDNVSMETNISPCIYNKSSDKVIIYLNGENTFTSNFTSKLSYETDTIDSAIYSKDDLTINGLSDSKMIINSKMHGIAAKDDLKITGSNIYINSLEKGIDANDSLNIINAYINITSGHDGIQLDNDLGDSLFYMESGSLEINSMYDGINVCGADGGIVIYGGNIKINAPTNGSNTSKSQTISQKGIKAEGYIQIGNANIEISSADDAIHSNSCISITSGTLSLSSSDDGIHADTSLLICGGDITISKAYEGIEALNIEITGGNLNITSSDDGVNAAGGTQDSSTRFNPWNQSGAQGTLKISGGNIYVNAQGDGLDSNGSVYISGGYIIVEGPTNGGNGALDKGDGANCVLSITGGVVLALGTTDMAINFDSGSQCSALVGISGGKGTTISVNDGSNFTFTASKSFACAVYSSPSMQKGNTYTITAGSNTKEMNFSSSYYYNAVSMGGGMQPGPRF